MTIKFIADYPPYKINQTTTLSAAEETALVGQKVAVTNLTGGTPYVPPALSKLASIVAEVLSKLQVLAGVISLVGQKEDGTLIGYDGNPISMGTVSRPSSTNLVLDAKSIYLPRTIAGVTAFNVSGDKEGAETSIMVIADGVNVPTINGADEWASSLGYLNTSGAPNLLTVWHDGLARRYSWSQQMVPTIVDNTAPTLSSASTNGASLTLTYSEALNTTSTAASAFSVVGAGGVTQAPSAVNISGSIVTLTLATPAVSGNTVTVSYTPPGSNPVRDLAGNAAAGLSNQGVNNLLSVPILELTSLTKLTQGTDINDDVYTADASGVTSFGAYGRSTLVLNGDGYVSVDWPAASNGALILGLDAANTVDWSANYPDYFMQLSTSAVTVSRGANSSSGTLIGAALTPAAGVRYRIRRTGTVGNNLFIDESSDAGANWTQRYNFAANVTGPLYVWIGTVQGNTIYRPRQVGMA